MPLSTVAVFSSGAPPALVATSTVIVTCAWPPAARSPRAHVTPPPAIVQLPWLAVVWTAVTAAGSGSSTVTPGAVLGPALVTTSV